MLLELVLLLVVAEMVVATVVDEWRLPVGRSLVGGVGPMLEVPLIRGRMAGCCGGEYILEINMFLLIFG